MVFDYLNPYEVTMNGLMVVHLLIPMNCLGKADQVLIFLELNTGRNGNGQVWRASQFQMTRKQSSACPQLSRVNILRFGLTTYHSDFAGNSVI